MDPITPILAPAAGAASALTDAGMGSVMDVLTQWLAGGAVWFLDRLGAIMNNTTTLDVTQQWFTSHYAIVAGLAVLSAAPIVFVSIVQSIVRQELSIAIRCVLVHLPMALVATGVAVEGVQFSVGLVDTMCTALTSTTGGDVTNLFAGMERWFFFPVASVGGPAAPGFVTFLLALLVAFGALVLWIEMVLRSAAVYVAVLFLPFVLVGTAMPATIPWCRRLVETLAALVLSKLVIVGTLSLALGALGGGGMPTPSQIVEGGALLLLATFAPFAILKLIPAVEAGAVHHLEGLSRRSLSAVAAPARRAAGTVAMASTGAGFVMNMRTAGSAGATSLGLGGGALGPKGGGGGIPVTRPSSPGPPSGGGSSDADAIPFGTGNGGDRALENHLSRLGEPNLGPPPVPAFPPGRLPSHPGPGRGAPFHDGISDHRARRTIPGPGES